MADLCLDTLLQSIAGLIQLGTRFKLFSVVLESAEIRTKPGMEDSPAESAYSL